MSGRKTPITDAMAAAEVHHIPMSALSLCVDLERDRAALIVALESIAQSDNPEHPVYGQNWHGSEAEFVKALQDEARATLAKVQS